MRTTADLNRIIDKIAENQPVRFETSSPNREEVSRSPAANSPETAPVAKKKEKTDAEENSRSFAPRLAADSNSSATAPTRSARGRRRPPTSEIPRFEPSRSAVKRVKNDKSVSVVNLSDANDKKRDGTESDEEAKRTQRRRQIDPTTCERDYSTDEIEFMKALDDYKRASGRMFPTCSEILEVFKSLGYVKTARAETSDDKPQQNAKPNRAATPAFLSDEENDAFEFNSAPVPGVA